MCVVRFKETKKNKNDNLNSIKYLGEGTWKFQKNRESMEHLE